MNEPRSIYFFGVDPQKTLLHNLLTMTLAVMVNIYTVSAAVKIMKGDN